LDSTVLDCAVKLYSIPEVKCILQINGLGVVASATTTSCPSTRPISAMKKQNNVDE